MASASSFVLSFFLRVCMRVRACVRGACMQQSTLDKVFEKMKAVETAQGSLAFLTWMRAAV